MNIGFFTGTLKDVDLQHLVDSGKSVCNFHLEIQPANEKQSPFVLPVVGWDDLAVTVSDLPIGSTVTVEGYVERVDTERPDGSKHKIVVVTAQRVESFNSLTLIGRVGGDPFVRHIEINGEPRTVANLTLAVTKRQRDADAPNWFDLELWGRTAEIAGEYVRKGSQIAVMGHLRIEFWEDKTTGETRHKPVVSVDRLELLGSKSTDSGNGNGHHSEGTAPSVSESVVPEPVTKEPPAKKSKAKKQ